MLLLLYTAIGRFTFTLAAALPVHKFRDAMPSPAITRLTEERKNWRRDHPYGFVAVPTKNYDGSLNLYVWKCSIPGPVGTPWAGGQYRLRMTFKKSYPETPPVCRFIPPIFHPNVIPTGLVCWSYISSNWDKATSVKDILVQLQTLLTEPNITGRLPNRVAAVLHKQNIIKYNIRIKNQARRMAWRD